MNTEEKEISTKERIHMLEIDRVLKEGVHDDLLNNRISLAEGKKCPLCLKRENQKVGIGTMRKKTGPYGQFLSCSLYPICKFTWNTPISEDTETENEKT